MPIRTVQDGLKKLEGAGLADHDVGKGEVSLWKALHEPTGESADLDTAEDDD